MARLESPRASTDRLQRSGGSGNASVDFTTDCFFNRILARVAVLPNLENVRSVVNVAFKVIEVWRIADDRSGATRGD